LLLFRPDALLASFRPGNADPQVSASERKGAVYERLRRNCLVLFGANISTTLTRCRNCSILSLRVTMKFLVLFAHPQKDSFQAKLHQCVLEALGAAGHVVDDCDLYAEQFQPVLTRSEMDTYHDVSRNVDSVKDYVDRLRAAEGLVFVFPTWWYGMPAILRGYLDRVWLPGVCFDIVDGKTIPSLRKVTRLVIVTTCGSPYWLNRFYVGELNKRFFRRGIGRLISPEAKIVWLAQYNMDKATVLTKERFISTVRTALSKI
jgi:NAD(P)H dehydrogenase (quinone)